MNLYRKAFIVITSFVFLFNLLHLGMTYYKMNMNCDILRENNRTEFQQCWRAKRIAARSIRRMWDGY